ncbi:MAG TPA: histidine phosphatase family protein [Desulfuromonadales bacterium]|jgi:phosphohistidine phosphatase
MKRLTLVRHAKSSWEDPALADFDRPLSKRGKQDAPLMGERLAGRDPRPELIISSPAKRARKTARLIARELELTDDRLILVMEIYEAEPEILLKVVRGLDNRWAHVLLVGHNPGLTELGNLLADCGIENIPTCGALCLDFDADDWQNLGSSSGSLVFYDYPKKPSI